MSIYSSDKQFGGLWKATVMEYSSNGTRLYIPALHRDQCPFQPESNPPTLLSTTSEGYFILSSGKNTVMKMSDYPMAQFCNWKVRTPLKPGDSVYVMFENGDSNYPVVIGNLGNTVQLLTGTGSSGSGSSGGSYTGTGLVGTGTLLSGKLTADLIKNTDMLELPHLTVEQLKVIIEKFWQKVNSIFSGKSSTDIANDIYKAQEETGLSALISLGIGAQESGWGTSSIAHAKNNIWGWGAYNSSPSASATTFSSDVYSQFVRWNDNFLSTYYKGYGATTLNAVGTGDNPAGMGYAYNNDGSINTSYPDTIASCIIMMLNVIPEELFVAAKSVSTSSNATIQNYLNSTAGTDAKEWGAGSGTQCVELPKHYIETVFGKSTKTMALGNGNQMYTMIPQAFPELFTSIKYSTGTQILPGDILSLRGVLVDYGHAAIVKSVSGNTVTILEQWSGAGTVQESSFTTSDGGKRTIIGIARPK